MKRKKLLITLSVLVGLVIFILVVRSAGLAEILEVIGSANKIWLALFVLIFATIRTIHVIRWHFILTSQGVQVSFWKLFLFKVTGFSVGYLTPIAQVGGEPIRALLLSREKVPYHKAFSSVLIDKSIELATNVSFAIIGFVFILLNYALTKNTILILVTALVAAAGLLTIFYYRILNSKGFFSTAYHWLGLNRFLPLKKYEQQIRDVEVSITKFFKFHRGTLKIALALSLLAWVFMFFEFEAALLALDYSPSISTLFLVIAITGTAYVFPVPAALGVLEGGHASLFSIINVAISKGVALGLLVRLRDLSWSMIGIFYLVNYRFSKRLLGK